ncbi:MAG TPA: hypothetical protein VNF07_08780 [Acidimicrobiales bacterium]|nr:hypothetical protein [Acidimicrobiales bacterium]
MPAQHVVVDGSNIATETRQLPSLAQLESALEELRKDFPEAEVTVVVDATFAHRIDSSELARFEAAQLRGEFVSPPAGAIGRGDAFLLRIAEKVDGTVLSNDSFQEFHGEHPWLFERGRLIGATPVPGVGWIFVPRTPVRGPKSRVATRDATREKAKVTKAIAVATLEVEHPESTPEQSEHRSRRTRAPAEKPQAVNDPITFISFIAEHKLGDEVDALVESFTSHGAVITYGEVRCYAPLANLAEPPPRSAREVLHRGATERFVITALDPYRRGIELALPAVAHISGRPSEETVEAEVRLSRRGRQRAQPEAVPLADAAAPAEVPAVGEAPEKLSPWRRSDPAPATESAGPPADGPAPSPPAGARPRRQRAAAVAPAAPAEGAATGPKKAPARKMAPQKAAAKKQPAKQAAAKKPIAQKRAAAKVAPEAVAAKRAPAKAAAKKQPAKKQPASEQTPAAAKGEPRRRTKAAGRPAEGRG